MFVYENRFLPHPIRRSHVGSLRSGLQSGDEMNKGRRHELKMLKHKKRLKNYRLEGETGNFYAFRSHGKPCSCALCSPGKVLTNGVKKKEQNETCFQISNSIFCSDTPTGNGYLLR